MKIKLKIVSRIIFFAILLFSFMFIFFHYDLFYISPLKGKYKMSSLNFVAFGDAGSKIINNDSGLVLLKIDKYNQIDFFKRSGVELIEDFKLSCGQCVDSDGNIYIYNLELSSGQRTKEESILKFDKNGKFIKTIFEDEYGYDNNKGIVKILILDEKFYYIYNNLNEFYVKNSENETIKTYTFDTNLSLSYNMSSLENVIILTKNGHFLKIDDDSKLELIYDCNKDKDSIPMYFSILDDESIIYTDIGTREFAIIEKNATDRKIILNSNEEFSQRPIYNCFDAKGRADNFKLVATDGSNVLSYNSLTDDRSIILDNFDFSQKFLVTYLIFITCVLILSFFIIYLSIFTFKKISSSKSFVTKISALVIVGIVLITGVFCVISFESFDSRLISEIKKREEVVSLIVRESLPIENIEKITNNSQYQSPEYKSIVNTIEDIFKKHGSMTEGFYCTLYKLTNDNKVLSVLFDLTGCLPTLTPSYNYEEDSIEYKIMSTKEGFISEPELWPTGYFVYSYEPIINRKGESIGIVEVGINIKALSEENNKLILTLFLNIVSMAVFIILLVLEILIFVKERGEVVKKCLNNDVKFLKEKSTNLQQHEDEKEFSIFINNPKEKINIYMSSGMSRLLVFLIYFTTSIVSGFSSLYAFSMIPDNSSISKEFLASIPISAEIFTSLLAIFTEGVFSKLIGRRKTAWIFSLFFCIGMFLKVIPNIWMFTLANAVCGFGWGALLRIVSELLAESNKIEDFNGYDSSCMNGAACALIFGSFLINFLDYFSVFLISALLSIFVIYFVVVYVKREKIDLEKTEDDKPKSMNFLKFLISPKVFIFFILVLIPMSVCDYFVGYFFPITADEMGLSETHIGYVCTANRLCAIIFGNMIVNYLSNRFKNSYVLFVYMILFSMAIIFFARYSSISVLIFSVVLLGVANSFGYTFLSDYFMNIKDVMKFGTDKASSINSLVSNISYMAAPFIFSFIINNNVTSGLFIIGFLIFICATIFLMSNFKISGLIKKKKVGGDSFE